MFRPYVCVNTESQMVESVLDMTDQMALDCNLEYRVVGKPQQWIPLAEEDGESLCT